MNDNTRYHQIAQQALEDARFNLDIRKVDIDEADKPLWTKMEQDLAEMLFRAYINNHTVDPV